MFVGAHIKYIKIQNIGLRAYIPVTLHVKLDRQRTAQEIIVIKYLKNTHSYQDNKQDNINV